MRLTGIEPALRKQLDPKSSASTNSATGADGWNVGAKVRIKNDICEYFALVFLLFICNVMEFLKKAMPFCAFFCPEKKPFSVVATCLRAVCGLMVCCLRLVCLAFVAQSGCLYGVVAVPLWCGGIVFAAQWQCVCAVNTMPSGGDFVGKSSWIACGDCKLLVCWMLWVFVRMAYLRADVCVVGCAQMFYKDF